MPAAADSRRPHAWVARVAGRLRIRVRVPAVLLPALAALGLAAGLATGQFTGPGRSRADPVARLEEPPLRPAEQPLTTTAVVDGNVRIQPRALSCALTAVVGTHGELETPGQFCRLSIRVTNIDSTFHDFAANAQMLIDSAGVGHPPSLDAMRIKRQPDVVSIGAHDELVMDLWFELPAGPPARAARLVGDDEASGALTVPTAPHRADGVLVRLDRSR